MSTIKCDYEGTQATKVGGRIINDSICLIIAQYTVQV